MAKLTIEGARAVKVPEGTRLVVAIMDAGVDILHRCGGYAKCTTCRVRFLAGEPARMTEAERNRLEANGQLGEFRLSCQCLVEGAMHVEPLMTLAESGFDDAGPDPEAYITPPPVWRDAPGDDDPRPLDPEDAPTGILD